MSGSNNGKAKGEFIGSRVGKGLTWYPPYKKANGNDVSTRLYIPIAVNDRQGHTDWYDLVAWGARADTLAHYLSQGKEMHFWTVNRSEDVVVTDNRGNIIYQAAIGTELDANKNPVAAGTQLAITTKRESHTVDEWIFGSDSANYEAWMNTQAANYPGGLEGIRAAQKAAAAMPYDGVSDMYGQAKVGKVNGTPVAHVKKTADGGTTAGGQPGINLQKGAQGAGATGAASPPPPPPTGGVQVEGYTMEQYIASGWTDAQLRADAKFAPFFAAAGAPPVPPAQAAGAGASPLPQYPGGGGV